MNEQTDPSSLISQNDPLDVVPTENNIQHQQHLLDQGQNASSKSKKVIFTVLGLVIVGLVIFLSISLTRNLHDMTDETICPVRIRLAVYDNLMILQNQSRVLEVLFYSGNDDRGQNPFKIVNMRDIVWKPEPEGVISIDSYGRIEALKPGNVTLTVISSCDSSVNDSKMIQVVSSVTQNSMFSFPKRIINYTGSPNRHFQSYQKIVQRYSKEQVQARIQIPVSIKRVSEDPINSIKKEKVTQNTLIEWSIEKYADGSNNSYVKRIDNNLNDENRDKIMYFIGTRYLPDDGKSVISIQDDNSMGIWIVGTTGNVTRIQMDIISYEDKARMMARNTQQNVLRHGIAAGANYNQNLKKWVPYFSDNDGLWTSLYAAGQLMRYDYLRQTNQSPEKIKQARQSALPSLKAVLITAWISGRNKTVDAKIRSFNNTRSMRGQRLSSFYLKANRTYSINNYVGSPSDKIGFYGVDAGKIINGVHYGGSYKYSLQPTKIRDWTLSEDPATTKRTLNGFISRTFVIPELDGSNFGGLFFRRNPNGSHTVLNSANSLYDYNATDHPTLELGDLPLPEILKSNLLINGKQYDVHDMVYKGQTSTDQIIGHLFLYKIAYDIMSQADEEESKLKELIRQTMINFCQHLLNNGYVMVDATGQGTSWSKLVRDFLNEDFTTEDAPLKAIQLLLCFKLAHYVTGDSKYKNEYEFLINDPSFKYGELVSQFWERWAFINQNEDDDPKHNLYRFNFTQNTTQQELQRHHAYTFHYSDDEQAMMAFYLAFQLQENQTLLSYYKKGMEAYWKHIKKTQNPLWYYIYQLGYPDEHDLKDGFGNKLLETASWQLSRHPIDTTTYQAFVLGSRADVIYEGILSMDPSKVIGTRTNKGDAEYVNSTVSYKIFSTFDPWKMYQVKVLPADERSIHKFNHVNYDSIHGGNINEMEASTTYTLPYWFGVYHGMLKHQDQ